jgi:hypothetical protein
VDFTTGVGVKEYIAKRNGLLTLEEPNYKLGEGGMLTSIVPTFGDVAVLQQPGSTRLLQESATDTTTPDLAAMGLDLCAICNAKVSDWLLEQRKRIKSAQSPFDSTGELSKAAAVNPDVVQEARATAGGLLEPESDHWFTQEIQDARLSGGLVRPDAMPDEAISRLRELMLAKSVPKSQRKLTSLELAKLGWLDDDVTEMVPSHQLAAGMIIPDF